MLLPLELLEWCVHASSNILKYIHVPGGIIMLLLTIAITSLYWWRDGGALTPRVASVVCTCRPGEQPCEWPPRVRLQSEKVDNVKCKLQKKWKNLELNSSNRAGKRKGTGKYSKAK
jgi:hypothetical protein